MGAPTAPLPSPLSPSAPPPPSRAPSLPTGGSTTCSSQTPQRTSTSASRSPQTRASLSSLARPESTPPRPLHPTSSSGAQTATRQPSRAPPPAPLTFGSARLTLPPRACTMSPSMASPTTARRTPPPPPRSSLRPPTSASLKTSPLPSPSLLL